MISYWRMKLEVACVDEAFKFVNNLTRIARIGIAIDIDFVPVTASARADLTVFRTKRLRCWGNRTEEHDIIDIYASRRPGALTITYWRPFLPYIG